MTLGASNATREAGSLVLPSLTGKICRQFWRGYHMAVSDPLGVVAQIPQRGWGPPLQIIEGVHAAAVTTRGETDFPSTACAKR